MSDIPYLSFSQINLYQRCGVQYYLKYIEKTPTPSNVALVKGKSFHSALEENFKQKIASGNDLPVDKILDVYRDSVVEGFNDNILLDPEETEGTEAVMGATVDSGVAMLKIYMAELAPTIQPLSVEEEVLISHRDVTGNSEELPVPLRMFIDIVAIDGTVYDHKTSAKTPPSSTADDSQQLTIYALGYKEHYGLLPSRLVLNYAIAPGKKSPAKCIAIETKRDENSINKLLNRVTRVVDGIQKGVFIPPEQGSFACSYCPYKRTGACKEF